MQCSRFYTDQNFKKRIIINSCSLRNLKWGQNNNDNGRKNSIETSTNQDLFNNNLKRLNSSNSTEKKKKEKILYKEEEEKRKEELSKKREMSYRARKRIILRMRGVPDEKEQKNEKEKNAIKKIRKIEIKIPSDSVKFKRVNSNNIINFNSSNFNNNDFDIIDKYNNLGNKNDTSRIIDNINTDNNINKIIKNNFVFYRNIRNIYKKNSIKDISVLTDKSCKILKVKNNNKEKNNKDYKNDKLNLQVNNIKKSNLLYTEKNKQNIDESKNEHNDNNRNVKSNDSMLTYLENQKNNKTLYTNLNDKESNDNDINDIYFSLNVSKKNLNRINSDFLENRKKNSYFEPNDNYLELYQFNNNEKNLLSNNINNKKKVKWKRNENSEKRYSNNNSFFSNILKPNYINKDYIIGKTYSEKTKTYKLYTHSHKSFKKENSNNTNMNMINLKILPNNHSGHNKYNSIESDFFDNHENDIKEKFFDKNFFMFHFFEELIDISNSLDDKNLLSTLLNNFNQRYYLIDDKDIEEYMKLFKENENFEYIFKHFGLVLICLIFFSKDESLYNLYYSNVKDLLTQLIYSSLNYVEIDGNKESIKIYNFINNNLQSVIPNHRYILSLIYLLFDNKKEYLPLKEALEQIHNIIVKKDLLYIIKIINDSILYCYNSKPKCLFNFPFFAFKNNILTIKNNQDKQNNDVNYTNHTGKIPNINFSSIKNNNNNLSDNNIHNKINNINSNNIQYNNVNNENIPIPPFIKSPMRKKFCLVLDIDETISHSLKLSFGCYFLLRPGAKSFLKEISKYYEIIIFTSSPKKYADKILNKIDNEGNLISHRLYRQHVLYENGKSVKNLNLIGRDLTKIIFVDNLRSNAKYNLNNLCPITTWRSDIFDSKLIKLKQKLINIATCGKYDNDITQGL